MSDRPVIVVAGLGRCGTSMMMQMLHAGGLPCAGTFPDFEPPETAVTAPIPLDWWATQRGRAVKVLDPHRRPVPRTAPRFVVWMDRDPVEQAKSHMKMLAHAFPGIPMDTSRSARRRLEASLLRDRELAHRSLGTVHWTVQFEAVLLEPTAIAAFLLEKLDAALPGMRLDPHAMSRAVVPRGSGCFPGMLELQLAARAGEHG